ncbi:hypothetical protein [Lysobacter enzymogenes]|nr:hypothetical protein [Lysobacter enzymogenes]QQQ01972.1 hypothetical protein JHW41_02975 [Lysobacter enzymogenes]
MPAIPDSRLRHRSRFARADSTFAELPRDKKRYRRDAKGMPTDSSMPPRNVDRFSSISAEEASGTDAASAAATAAVQALIPHRTRELAITYGLGARLHHGERHWDDIRDELARGWERLRGAERASWSQVEADVEGAWRLVLAD